MNAPLLWVIVPLTAGLLLMLLSDHQKLTKLTALLICLLLAAIAWLIPINSMIIFGSNTSLVFTDSMNILGRQLILERAHQPLLVFLFLLSAAWILASLVVRTHRFLVPILMMQLALTIGMVSVKPLTYGIYFILLQTILPIPILWVQRKTDGSGLMRSLLSQSMGMMFLGIGGWLMNAVALNTADTLLIQRVVMMILIGFIFWLGIFPLHSWFVIMMTNFPLISVGFTLSLQQFSLFYLLLKYLNEYLWMRNFTPLYLGMIGIGLVMLFFGSLIALFARNPMRLFASLWLAENGVALAAIGMKSERGLNAFFALLVFRMLVMLIWALIDAAEQDALHRNGYESEMAPSASENRFLTGSQIIAYFSLAGLPLLPAFPEKIALLGELSRTSAGNGSLLMLGFVALSAAGLSLIKKLLSEKTALALPRRAIAAIVIALAVLILIGIFPPQTQGLVSLLLAPFNAVLS